jgi:tetratricopeptide (TPR) repeat protein
MRHRRTRKALLGALLAALLVPAWACRTPRPDRVEVPEEDIRAMLERKGQALGLFEEALAAEAQDERKELYLRALSLDPGLGKAHNNLGLIYLEEGDYGEAVRLLREAAKRMPGSPAPRFNLGYAYELVGRLGAAEEHYAAAARMAPDEPDYLESLARVHIRRRDHLGEARDVLMAALRVETRPEHVKWINAQLESLQKGFVP